MAMEGNEQISYAQEILNAQGSRNYLLCTKEPKKTNCCCHAATVIDKYSWVQNQKDYIISSNSNEIKNIFP